MSLEKQLNKALKTFGAMDKAARAKEAKRLGVCPPTTKRDKEQYDMAARGIGMLALAVENMPMLAAAMANCLAYVTQAGGTSRAQFLEIMGKEWDLALETRKEGGP